MTCYVCQQDKQADEFGMTRGGHQRRLICLLCEREGRAMSSAERHVRNRAIIEQAKSVPCADCGRQFVVQAMHMDHVRGEKAFQLSAVPDCSVERLLAEIAKCEVRCAICHVVRHLGIDPAVAWRDNGGLMYVEVQVT
jgi:hypothetical protein